MDGFVNKKTNVRYSSRGEGPPELRIFKSDRGSEPRSDRGKIFSTMDPSIRLLLLVCDVYVAGTQRFH